MGGNCPGIVSDAAFHREAYLLLYRKWDERPDDRWTVRLLPSALLHAVHRTLPRRIPMGISGQLYLIMDALIQGSSNKKRLQGGKLSRFYAQEALSFIEQNYALPITVEDMANRCNLDRSYFGKVFKDMIGQSPQDFLIRYRMSKATSLLTSTSLSIGDISVQVGYPNQLHFSRAFRNIYGMSPRQYRQQNKLLS